MRGYLLSVRQLAHTLRWNSLQERRPRGAGLHFALISFGERRRGNDKPRRSQ
jgi:hypothetical protein